MMRLSAKQHDRNGYGTVGDPNAVTLRAERSLEVQPRHQGGRAAFNTRSHVGFYRVTQGFIGLVAYDSSQAFIDFDKAFIGHHRFDVCDFTILRRFHRGFTRTFMILYKFFMAAKLIFGRFYAGAIGLCRHS